MESQGDNQNLVTNKLPEAQEKANDYQFFQFWIWLIKDVVVGFWVNLHIEKCKTEAIPSLFRQPAENFSNGRKHWNI